MINYISTLPAQQIENLIKNLMVVSDLLITDKFEQHVAVENLIADLHQRFQLIG
jgi:cell division FtsZ-interacting protein ZapD